MVDIGSADASLPRFYDLQEATRTDGVLGDGELGRFCVDVLEAVPDAVFVYQVERAGFRCVHANQAGLSLLESTADEVIGQCVSDYMAPDDVVLTEANLSRAIASEQPLEYLRTIEVPAGRATLEVVARPLRTTGDPPTHVVTVAHDVSSRDLARELITSVAHELRTPLAVMVGFADVLGKDTDELTDTDRAEMLAAVASQGFEIASIMDNLTVAARIDLADLFVESSPLEPAAEVAQVLGQLPAASAAQIRTTGTAPPALANSLRVRQVLRVMLSNAARHGKPPISISLSQRPGFVELSVIDHGEGVDPIDTQRIFSPYQTAPTDGTTPQSLGIGLYVGRYLARSMGGDLTYERRQDETMFCLTLPVASDTAT